MQQNTNEIEINGAKYIPKGSEQKIDSKNAVIVRCESAGVFFGYLHESNLGQGTATLKQARRLWYWSGAASLSQLAVDGTKKPTECKFPVSVQEISVAKVIEIIPCTEAAVKSISEVVIWKQ